MSKQTVNGQPLHPAVEMYKNEFLEGKLSRREFFARASALGASTAAIYSMGGLLIRGFFADEANAEFAKHRARVVMIGTPNNGTQIVDRFADQTWFKWLGEASLSLGTDDNSFPMGLPLPDFRAGIIAGTDSYSELTDEIIGEANDGTVPVQSTKLPNMADFFSIYANHSMLRYNVEVARQTIYFLKHGHFDHPTKLASCVGHASCSPATM